MLLPQAGLDEAVTVAEKLRRLVETAPLPGLEGVQPPTVSIGAAAVEPSTTEATPLSLLDRADRALLEAKAQGRNRVVRARP